MGLGRIICEEELFRELGKDGLQVRLVLGSDSIWGYICLKGHVK